MKGNFTEMELGGRRVFTHMLLEVNADTNNKRPFLHPQQEVTLFYYQEEEERFFPCLATAHSIRDSHNLANENPLYSDLLVSVNTLCL